MIPVLLTLEGFLSYRDAVSVDLSAVEVACVSGANGAGKSSLLDAITWALFGKARRSDDALINDGADACRVSLTFDYEGSRYRVQREKPRGKGALLEFQVRADDGNWKVLTEAGLRQTEEHIRDVLRLDYDTFINASFFLQGKADMFTQQAPSRRKEILSSILGLEIWEAYRTEAALRRRSADGEARHTRAWLDEVLKELAEEPERVERHNLLRAMLEKTSKLRAALEEHWANSQQRAQEVRLEGEKLALLETQLSGARARRDAAAEASRARSTELKENELLLADAVQIEKDFESWQGLRESLERWNSLAAAHHEKQSERAALDAQIKAEGARLNQEALGLRERQKEALVIEAHLPEMRDRLAALNASLAETDALLEEVPVLEAQRGEATSQHADLTAAYKQLQANREAAEKRLDALASATGSDCPLCGQALTEQHRVNMRAGLTQELAHLDEQLAATRKEGTALNESLKEIDVRLAGLKKLGLSRSAKQTELGGLNALIAQHESARGQWETDGQPRLKKLEALLSAQAYSIEAREKLRAIDADILSGGYDAGAHEAARQAELAARSAETRLRALEKARAAVAGLRRELLTLAESKTAAETEMSSLTAAFTELQKSLALRKENLPDLAALQAEMAALKQEENKLREDTGAAQQMVAVLEAQRRKKVEYESALTDINRTIGRLKMLEIAFGKDGIPALLIEQALPEIETQANDILDRLSGGRMSLTFETEKEYKDKKRDDKKATLDILISDSSGRREYELFSGGEAFRINFAIRLALSRVLAGRAGARLRTLVIDEGFGSQDADGIQRLIEAIRLVSPDFAKILVITHLDELKDAFLSRIEVTKTESGSHVEVIA